LDELKLLKFTIGTIGGLVLGLSQFSLQTQLPQKMTLQKWSKVAQK